MKQIAAAIIVVLGITAIIALSSGWLDIGESGHVSWKTPAPRATLDAGDAAAHATMIAQQQSAQMTASAAQSELGATARAAEAQATEQAMVADQAFLDNMATQQAESTAQALQATAEHAASLATSTAAAATATRQAEVRAVTVTAESIQIDIEERIIKKAEAEEALGRFAAYALGTSIVLVLALAAIWSAIILMREIRRGEECKKKVTLLQP